MIENSSSESNKEVAAKLITIMRQRILVRYRVSPVSGAPDMLRYEAKLAAICKQRLVFHLAIMTLHPKDIGAEDYKTKIVEDIEGELVAAVNVWENTGLEAWCTPEQFVGVAQFKQGSRAVLPVTSEHFSIFHGWLAMHLAAEADGLFTRRPVPDMDKADLFMTAIDGRFSSFLARSVHKHLMSSFGY